MKTYDARIENWPTYEARPPIFKSIVLTDENIMEIAHKNGFSLRPRRIVEGDEGFPWFLVIEEQGTEGILAHSLEPGDRILLREGNPQAGESPWVLAKIYYGVDAQAQERTDTGFDRYYALVEDDHYPG